VLSGVAAVKHRFNRCFVVALLFLYVFFCTNSRLYPCVCNAGLLNVCGCIVQAACSLSLGLIFERPLIGRLPALTYLSRWHLRWLLFQHAVINAVWSGVKKSPRCVIFRALLLQILYFCIITYFHAKERKKTAELVFCASFFLFRVRVLRTSIFNTHCSLTYRHFFSFANQLLYDSHRFSMSDQKC